MADGEGDAPRVQVTHSNASSMKQLFLNSPGEPEIKWPVWQKMFNDFILASNLTGIPEARKLAILRSSLGSEGYRICSELCPEDDITYANTITRLTNRFAPKPSQILERANYIRRNQLANEDSSQFVTTLRTLISKCGYPDTVFESLIRDRFVATSNNEKVREKLLLEPDTLTLNDALTHAMNIERAMKELRALDGSSPVDKINATRNSQRNYNNNSFRNNNRSFPPQ